MMAKQEMTYATNTTEGGGLSLAAIRDAAMKVRALGQPEMELLVIEDAIWQRLRTGLEERLRAADNAARPGPEAINLLGIPIVVRPDRAAALAEVRERVRAGCRAWVVISLDGDEIVCLNGGQLELWAQPP